MLRGLWRKRHSRPFDLDTTADTTATPRCLLLELPKETRLQIYKCLIKPEEIHITSGDNPTIEGLSREEVAKTRFRAKTHRYCGRMQGEKVHTPLLRTCRQIYQECLPILVRPDLLVVRPADFHAGPQDGPFKDISFVSQLSHLDTLEVHHGSPTEPMEEELVHARFFSDLLSKEIRVKTLKVVVEKFSGDWWDMTGLVWEYRAWVGHIEENLKVWSWIRPNERFEYEIDVSSEESPSHWGSWDSRDDELRWRQDCENYWGDGEESDRRAEIVEIIKKMFPLPKL